MSRVELGLEFGIEQRHRELLSKLLVAPINLKTAVAGPKMAHLAKV
jgi:hypothetical protein